MTIMVFFSVAALWMVGETQMTHPSGIRIPPIDMLQTGTVKTATFALG